MSNYKTKKRLAFFFGIIALLIVIMCARAAWWQIVKADEMSDRAKAQQTRDDIVEAERGTIYDRNGEKIALSATAYTVYVRPSSVASYSEESKNNKQIDNTVNVLSDLLDMKKSKIRKLVTSEDPLVKLSDGVDSEVADSIREYMKSSDDRDFVLTGIELSETSKRYYPKGEYLSHVLGCLNTSGIGISGVEQYYNSTLTGISGRWSRNTDVNGNRLSYGQDKYYEPEDGSDITLTIDEVIQSYVEKYIKQTHKSTKSKRVMCIAMEVETGNILAMAVTPSFDPNEPLEPMKGDSKEFDEMSPNEQLSYLTGMWRNPLVSDVYEPGSTFKLLTASIALEEGVVDLNDTFVCNGKMQVEDYEIKCWSDDPHGTQTIKEAVGNSCNPALMQIGKRIGITRFYNYLDQFGITGKTDIDLPAEGTAILQERDEAGPVGLATLSFGHGIAVTPIQLITAVSAIGNEGKLMKPHIVSKITDEDGEVIMRSEPELVRKVISKKTANTVCDIMEYAVTDGGVEKASVEGYRIGGKTGTAYKAEAGGYSEETYSSFIGLAPIDDPKVAVLVIVDEPQGVKYGSQTAAPCGHKIFKSILPYLGIDSTSETKGSDTGKKKVEVPDITGMKSQKAIAVLEKQGLKYKIKNGDSKKNFKVVSQYPAAGAKVSKGSNVYIYGE